jgi:hypothetical protein
MSIEASPGLSSYFRLRNLANATPPTPSASNARLAGSGTGVGTTPAQTWLAVRRAMTDASARIRMTDSPLIDNIRAAKRDWNERDTSKRSRFARKILSISALGRTKALKHLSMGRLLDSDRNRVQVLCGDLGQRMATNVGSGQTFSEPGGGSGPPPHGVDTMRDSGAQIRWQGEHSQDDELERQQVMVGRIPSQVYGHHERVRGPCPNKHEQRGAVPVVRGAESRDQPDSSRIRPTSVQSPFPCSRCIEF